MFKVIFHYGTEGEDKRLVADVFMTLTEAREYILDQFDKNVEGRNEFDETSRLPEGRAAEICAEVILRNYSIEYFNHNA